MSELVLFGAGTTGRIIARDYKERVLCFADSDSSKLNALMEGFEVLTPLAARALYPDAVWIASTIIPTFHREITEEIEKLGVKTTPVWEFLPQRTTPPPHNVALELLAMVADDKESYDELCDQIDLRRNPQHHQQRPPSDIKEIYFPEFITHSDEEVYWDCGAADGDTVKEFAKRWPTWKQIYAIEPDRANIKKLMQLDGKVKNFYAGNFVVSDHQGQTSFTETGDYSSHVDRAGDYLAPVARLDDFIGGSGPMPTYIKMDIEGSEPAALWGARRILKEHSPVLAICAYHESDHFWLIPLLVHALQPDYRLYFRRYAQGSFEIIWYFVPPERVKQ